MKKTPALLALMSLAIPMTATADRFILKDGTTLEASIASETPDSYVLEVQVTKSIRDERKVAKADVVKVEREQPGCESLRGH